MQCMQHTPMCALRRASQSHAELCPRECSTACACVSVCVHAIPCCMLCCLRLCAYVRAILCAYVRPICGACSAWNAMPTDSCKPPWLTGCAQARPLDRIEISPAQGPRAAPSGRLTSIQATKLYWANSDAHRPSSAPRIQINPPYAPRSR